MVIFWDHDNPGPSITNYGTITSGRYLMPVINHGTIIDGVYFFIPLSNESDGTIENGTFISNVTNNGIINGGIFRKKPTDGNTVHKGYTLNVNQNNGSTTATAINGLSIPLVILFPILPDTSVTIKYLFP